MLQQTELHAGEALLSKCPDILFTWQVSRAVWSPSWAKVLTAQRLRKSQSSAQTLWSLQLRQPALNQ